MCPPDCYIPRRPDYFPGLCVFQTVLGGTGQNRTVPKLTVIPVLYCTLFSEQRLDANVCWQVLIVDGPGGGAFGLGAVSEVVEPPLEFHLQIQGLGFSDCLGGGFQGSKIVPD